MKTGAAALISKPGPRGRARPARSRRKPLKPLTDGQAKFLARYLLHFNAARAYREAYPGCSDNTARDAGAELVRHPCIAPTIKAARAEVRARYLPSKNNALAELAALAFSNVQDFYNDQGGLKPLTELPRHASAAIRKLKSKEIKATDLVTGEERVIGHEREIELHDKVAALRLVGQHAGLFGDDPDAKGVMRDFSELLREARARLAGSNQVGALPAIAGESRRETDGGSGERGK